MAFVDDSVFNPFRDFVNLELPRRSAFLTVAITGYDGDPNGGGAPAILQGAPVGTWYFRETPEKTTYRKYDTSATSWVVQGTESGTSTNATLESLTFPIDYTDGTAVDPPADTVFAQQSEINAYLSDNGATNFKHVQLVFEALPRFIDHDVTFNLAAGVHRPIPTASTRSFHFADKFFGSGGSLLFQGATSASYTTLVGSQSITGVQTAGGDPYLDFGGTPFTGLDLRGTYAVLSTGQVALIHDHTDSRLYLVQTLSPDPTGGTCTVAQPSTILRNSLDDSATTTNVAVRFSVGLPSQTVIDMNDLIIDPFGASGNNLICDGCGVRYERVILDQLSMVAAFGKTPNGNGWNATNFGKMTMTSCSVRGVKPATGGADSHIFVGTGAQCSIFGMYVGGGEDPVRALGADFITAYGLILDQVGTASFQSLLVDGVGVRMFLAHSPTFAEKKNEVRDAAGIGVEITEGAVGSIVQNMQFKNCAGACVKVGSNVSLDVAQSYLDLGGNGDVGIDVVGPAARVTITTATDVTGSNGDVRIGGAVFSYADITAADDSTLTTFDLNTITRT